MIANPEGSLRLFRFAGIQVYLHWSWFLIAAYEVSNRKGMYSSVGWNVAEYLALFAIVLLHEFGHSLACRQVGGSANQIVLWPLGGVAYVSPPPRPGATLWSIAAGPLVNFILVPVIMGITLFARYRGLLQSNPDLRQFLYDLSRINFGLLLFNVLPVYPLDGGQILRSLLWFGLGASKSLFVATLVGFVGIAALGVYAFYLQSLWIGMMVLFLASNCFASFKYARALMASERLPRP